MNQPRASIIIAVYGQLAYTKLAVEHIMKHTDGTHYELIIVDNGSASDVKQYFDSLGKDLRVVYIRNESNLGPIRAINQGIAASSGRYVGVIHNDVLILEDGWLVKIVGYMDDHPRVGVAALAGRKEIYKTGSVNEESLKHRLQNEDLNPPMAEDVARVAVVDGLCFFLRRDLLDKVKGLDESFGYMHCYDLDISLASIANGFENVVIGIEAIHISNGGITRKTKGYKELVKDDYGLLKKNCAILSRKWRHILPLKV